MLWLACAQRHDGRNWRTSMPLLLFLVGRLQPKAGTVIDAMLIVSPIEQQKKVKASIRAKVEQPFRVEEVAREVYISVGTLQRWHSEAREQSPGKKVGRLAAARFEAVLVTAVWTRHVRLPFSMRMQH